MSVAKKNFKLNSNFQIKSAFCIAILFEFYQLGYIVQDLFLNFLFENNLHSLCTVNTKILD